MLPMASAGEDSCPPKQLNYIRAGTARLSIWLPLTPSRQSKKSPLAVELSVVGGEFDGVEVADTGLVEGAGSTMMVAPRSL